MAMSIAREKPLGADHWARKFNPHLALSSGIEPGPDGWKVIAFKTVPIRKKEWHLTCNGLEFVKMEDCIMVLQYVTILVAVATKEERTLVT